eukprot:9160876-Pyramimonas_sp.AAC.1
MHAQKDATRGSLISMWARSGGAQRGACGDAHGGGAHGFAAPRVGVHGPGEGDCRLLRGHAGRSHGARRARRARGGWGGWGERAGPPGEQRHGRAGRAERPPGAAGAARGGRQRGGAKQI